MGNGETNSVGEPLAERASGDLDTVCMASLRVTRSQGAKLTELLEVIERELVAEEVEENVLERATALHSIYTYSCAIWVHLRMSRMHRGQIASI